MYQNGRLTPDRLLAGANDNYVERGILCAGNQLAALPRGAVLGAISMQIQPAVDDAANAGDGTVGGESLGSGAKPTVYTLTALDPATFSVVDADGTAYANATVGVAYAGPIACLITAGLVPFVAGDKFTIEVLEAAIPVLGAISMQIQPAVDNAANVGNGVVSGEMLLTGAQITTYTLTAVDATTFSVVDGNNVEYANATVGVPYTGPIAFRIAAGLIPFAAGDEFTIDVIRPLLIEHVLVDSTKVDGSNAAVCILAEDVDVTGPDPVPAAAYFAGEFNERELVFGGADVADDHRDALRDKGIFMRYTTPV